MGVVALMGAICGGIGNPTMQLLIDEYTWRGAMLVLGAYTLNIIPCGLVAHRADAIIQCHKKEVKARIFAESTEQKCRACNGKEDDVIQIAPTTTQTLVTRGWFTI